MMMIKIFVSMIVFYMFIHFNNERYIHSPLHLCLKFNYCGSFLNFYSTGEAMWLATNVSDTFDTAKQSLPGGCGTVCGIWHITSNWLALHFVNSWCENRLGDPSVAMHSGTYNWGKFPPFLKAADCPVAHPICAILCKDTVQSIRYW